MIALSNKDGQPEGTSPVEAMLKQYRCAYATPYSA